MYGIIAEGHFDSAHFLADYQGKCEAIHGHRWRVEATFAKERLGSQGTERDMVMDFSSAKRAVATVCAKLDHAFLVEEGTLAPSTIEALQSEGFCVTLLPFRTTAENFARHIFERLASAGFPVVRVEVDETPRNRAFFEG